MDGQHMPRGVRQRSPFLLHHLLTGMIFQAHQSFENLPGDSKSFPPKSWDFSAQKTHRKIWLRKPTTEYQQCFWETSLSIEVFEWFVLKSLVHEIVISITLWIPMALRGKIGAPQAHCHPGMRQSEFSAEVTTWFIATSAATKRIKFWVYLGGGSLILKIHGCFSWFSKLKPWNPLRAMSIWVVLIIFFTSAFSHGHHLASWESCPTSWDIPLLSNHSIHSCFIKANVKTGNGES